MKRRPTKTEGAQGEHVPSPTGVAVLRSRQDRRSIVGGVPSATDRPGRAGAELIREAVATLDRVAYWCRDLNREDPLVLADLRRVDELLIEAAGHGGRVGELAYKIGLCSFGLGTAVRSGEQRHLDDATARRERLTADLHDLLGG